MSSSHGRLRTSCDTCQSLKVRCSQTKPECQRCVKHALRCIYSPFRRMGRPRKTTTAQTPSRSSAPDRFNPVSQWPTPQSRLTGASGRGVPGLPVAMADFYDGTIIPSPGGRISSLSQDLPIAAPFSSNSNHLGPQLEDSHDGWPLRQAMTADTTSSSHRFTELLALPAAEESDCAEFNTPSSGNAAIPLPDIVPGPNTNSINPPWLQSPPVLALHDETPPPGNRKANESNNSSETSTQPAVPCQAQCHISILHRLAWIEHSLAAQEGPTSIDVILTADRDLRILKNRLFSCSECRTGCLHSRPSSILSLGLLAERVVILLEDLFHRAAELAHNRDHAFRTAWLMTSSSTSESDPQHSAVRFERSMRGAFDRNINCPIPEANCDLSVGKYQLTGDAKARAMKQILRQRIGKLSAVLADMEAWLAPGAGGAGSSVVLGAARHVAEDLHYRVGSLQGRVALAE